MSAELAEAIRLELRKGSYQMMGDTFPYETQAGNIAEVLAAKGYGRLSEPVADVCPYDCDSCHDEDCPCDRLGCAGSV